MWCMYNIILLISLFSCVLKLVLLGDTFVVKTLIFMTLFHYRHIASIVMVIIAMHKHTSFTSCYAVLCMYKIILLNSLFFYVLKLVLLGDTYVAKTSIIRRFCHNRFIYNSGPTIGLLQHCPLHLHVYLPQHMALFSYVSCRCKLHK